MTATATVDFETYHDYVSHITGSTGCEKTCEATLEDLMSITAAYHGLPATESHIDLIIDELFCFGMTEAEVELAINCLKGLVTVDYDDNLDPTFTVSE